MAKESKRLTRDSMRHFYRSVLQIVRIAYEAAPLLLIATLLVNSIQALLPVGTAFLFKLIFDRLGMVLSGEAPFSFQGDILPLVLVYGGLIIISQTTLAIDSYLGQEMGRKLQIHTSHMIYSHLLKFQGLTYFESPEFHNTLEETTDKLVWIPAHLIREMSSFFNSVISLLSFFGIVLFFSPILALILIIATIPAFMAQFRFRRKRFELSWKNTPKRRKMWYLGSLLSQTRHAKEVRLFNLGRYMLNQYLTTTEEVHQSRRELEQDELKVNAGLNVLSSLITIGTYIYVIGQAFTLTITLGDVTLYIDAVRNVQAQLGILSKTIISLSERTLFFSHYETLIGLKPTLKQLEPTLDPPPLVDEIELRNVSFRYSDESEYVLRDINLTLKKGESLALIGLNGAGKTTLIKLLSRFYDPTAGQILWDGVDVRHYRPEALRERLAAVLQDFARYDLSARENIGLGDISVIDNLEAIRAAAEEVGVARFIEDLSYGYETVLSRWLVEDQEDGTDLSGGQWQKIAISRAYLRNADLLMLDEPTAALDAEAEHEIYERFAEIASDKATILISHRFSTVRMADKIAVLKAGEISEYGSHWELVELGGEYAKLYGMQAKQYS